jgi:hypothetical protein
MNPGVLYVSIPYLICGHLCCCGCGEEVITPLSPAGWSLTYNGDSVSLYPSVGNWSLKCNSHYWIRNGHVHWSRKFTPDEIVSTRARDRQALQHWSAGSRKPPNQSRFRRLLTRLSAK